MRKAMEDMNQRLGGLPRRALLVLITLLAAYAAWALLPYFAPFALGFMLSCLLKPVVDRLDKGLGRFRLPRVAGTLLCMLLLYGLILWLAGVSSFRLLKQAAALIRMIPQWLSTVVVPTLERLYTQYQAFLPDSVYALTQNALISLGQTAASAAARLSGTLATGAVATATGLPAALLATVLSIMATYYFTADRQRITAFLVRTLPKGWTQRLRQLRKAFGQAVLGQIKSQLILSLILTCALVLALVIYGVPYGLLVGLLIGLMDALPVVGAGLFLIPWCILCFVMGDVGQGVFVLCLYIGTVLLRQVLEPRIVGKHLNIYPLATMIAMYAGFKLLGFLGLLIGPVLLSLCRVVLTVDQAAQGAVSQA